MGSTRWISADPADQLVARFLKGLAVALGILYLGACLGLAVFQRRFIYFPTPVVDVSHPDDFTLERDGVRLKISAKAYPGPGAVIYFGGNAEDVSRSLEPLAKAFPDRALYLMHYRGYGGSTGQPTEQSLVADGMALFDCAAKVHPNVVIVGRSLGSGVAVQVAAARPAQRLVLVTPFDSLVALGQAQFPVFPVGLLMRDRFESWRVAPKVSVPTRMLAAESDEVIPRASTERLLNSFIPGTAMMITIPGVGHNTISAHPGYLRGLGAE